MKYSGIRMDLKNREKWIAIIGSREAKEDELQAAYYLGMESAKKGLIVVSGLAKGVDAYAHKGAIDGGGRTIAIVSSTIEEGIYPKENTELAKKIERNGCILYPFETPVRNDNSKLEKPSHFIKRLLERDCLLAYLCPAIVAVKSGEVIQGGTRYAVNYGKQFGKKVYRMNSERKFFADPNSEYGKIGWEMELKMK